MKTAIDWGFVQTNNVFVRNLAAVFKTALFTILVPGTVAGYIPWALRRHAAIATHGLEEVASIAVIATGILIYLHTAFWGFAWTGSGTPAPIAPTSTLVVRGLHHYVRNPMYLGVALTIAGQAWLFHSREDATFAVCMILIAHLFVISYEEPALRKQFGEEYARYRARVPRWIPKIRL